MKEIIKMKSGSRVPKNSFYEKIYTVSLNGGFLGGVTVSEAIVSLFIYKSSLMYMHVPELGGWICSVIGG